jgi:hypothetical protein
MVQETDESKFFFFSSFINCFFQILLTTPPPLSFANARNVKLLSFGADEDAGEDDEPVVFKKKSIVRPDCTFTTPLP